MGFYKRMYTWWPFFMIGFDSYVRFLFWQKSSKKTTKKQQKDPQNSLTHTDWFQAASVNIIEKICN